jgi:hypothetical protein
MALRTCHRAGRAADKPNWSCAGSAAAAQILAAERQDIEGVELDLVVVPARVQGVEVGDAVDAEHQPRRRW